MQEIREPLPDWTVDQWFNTPKSLDLSDLRGKVVVIEAFQMLCPGCVAHGLPLAQQIHETFPAKDVAVIGVHTVFEHHAAMPPVSLEAFLHEYRITFPVAVDRPGQAALPATMERYGLPGTPTLLLVDRNGALAARHFGQLSSLKLGAEIMSLVTGDGTAQPAPPDPGSGQCDDNGCVV